jgi:hypothetical protein
VGTANENFSHDFLAVGSDQRLRHLVSDCAELCERSFEVCKIRVQMQKSWKVEVKILFIV